MNILVVPCGTEIGLEVQRSLKGVKNVKLFGLNSINDYSSTVFENFYSGAPFVDETNFIDYLQEFVSKYQITHIIPAHDSAALALSVNKELFGDQVKIITSSAETNQICRSKKQTYKALGAVVSTPKSFQNESDINESHLPLFVKPDVGQGSKGAFKVTAIEQLKNVNFAENVVTEYLPGAEYTVDCFTDNKGDLLYSGPRIRNRIQNGIAVSTKTIADVDETFSIFARKINSVLCFKGAWFFQVKKNDDGELVLMEAATRIAGSMSTNRVKGVNFAELSLYTHNDISVNVSPNDYQVNQERALTNKYKINVKYKHVYVDFDDCLVINDKVNEQLVSFLYKAINEGCGIYLVTRHEFDLTKSLAKYRLTGLFDEIFHITDGSAKSTVMTHSDAVFIDDSFKERADVLDYGIPSFSVDCVEALI
ncbi:ATP-grasp domain-containing protein [Colwelliaceae bacterium MEBiC 14330]